MRKKLENLGQTIKAWLHQENASRTRQFFQISALIVGGIIAMLLGAIVVGIILIASPFLTVLILLFLAIYGIVAALKS
ncbi:hypothetical protein [Oligoflexus tunisiensis]|uniref:hypothetical protein n=1 Tax=Oligoflexus tunisiensis TaxID=708132 RepID=UPI00114CD2BF|nr:hypothetical protein [Oligoflexus tunisiensis]